jgi:alpha,alpha-trehalase
MGARRRGDDVTTHTPYVVLVPARHRAVVFDLDGVLTDTASVHESAWRELFDAFLTGADLPAGTDRSPFTPDDYRRYVDGRPRYDGVATFLASRSVDLPWGDPSDAPDRETVCGLGNRKDAHFVQRLRRDAAELIPGAESLVRDLHDAGVPMAVVSASRNAHEVLTAVGLRPLVPVLVDGVIAADRGLPGKPDPATFLEAVRALGVEAADAVVVEDAQAGVEAGRAGGFGLVVGVDRTGGDELRGHGADVVVPDLTRVGLVEAPSG